MVIVVIAELAAQGVGEAGTGAVSAGARLRSAAGGRGRGAVPPAAPSDPTHRAAHLMVKSPGSEVNPTPVRLRVPDFAVNEL